MAWIRTDIGRTPLVTPAGYGPTDLQSAYKLPSATNGAGQTIAIVDAFDDPNVEADLAQYRSTFALGACTSASGCFMKLNQSGVTGPYPTPDSGWAEEISLDLDMASAVCPNCKLMLVEANTNNNVDLDAAVDAAVTCGATVVSNSWNGNEYPTEVSVEDSHFNHPAVPITVASGDNGFGAGYPSASHFVTSVGGTTLVPSGNARGWDETVWNGTGSGCSAFVAQPAWQTALGSAYTSKCGKRIENDVAAIGDPNTGVAVYDTYKDPGWLVFGGTSVATPIIAGVYALAGNGASINDGSFSYSHTSSLFDVTSGSNGSCSGTYLCTAQAGYDGPTGNGTPNGTGGF